VLTCGVTYEWALHTEVPPKGETVYPGYARQQMVVTSLQIPQTMTFPTCRNWSVTARITHFALRGAGESLILWNACAPIEVVGGVTPVLRLPPFGFDGMFEGWGSLTAAAPAADDDDRWPHFCPRCKQKGYMGLRTFEHRSGGKCLTP